MRFRRLQKVGAPLCVLPPSLSSAARRPLAAGSTEGNVATLRVMLSPVFRSQPPPGRWLCRVASSHPISRFATPRNPPPPPPPFSPRQDRPAGDAVCHLRHRRLFCVLLHPPDRPGESSAPAVRPAEPGRAETQLPDASDPNGAARRHQIHLRGTLRQSDAPGEGCRLPEVRPVCPHSIQSRPLLLALRRLVACAFSLWCLVRSKPEPA